MAGVALGLLIAACFGSGDFAGGMASRRASTPGALIVSQGASAIGALVLVLLFHGRIGTGDLVLGAAAGFSNVAGLALLYSALARHAAGVVAPVAAVVGASVPVAWGFAQGERAPTVVIAGVVAAVAAGGVLSFGPSSGETRGRVAAGTFRAFAAGVGLGTSLVLFNQTNHRSGQWPVLAARIAAATAAACFLLTRRARPALPTGATGALACAAGVFDVAATAVLVVAVRRALLVVVAPVASLGPAFTVLCAWKFQRERLERRQVAGLACALMGLVLMSSG